jgi:hypothetical protein
MRVNRRLLYSGVFFTAIGAVLVAVDVHAVDTTAIADALRLWPLAIVAIGVGLILRRTRLSLPGGMLAAALPGLLLGGGFAVAPRIAVDCGAGSAPSSAATQQGVFAAPARVSVRTACGRIDVTTAPGAGWQFQASDTSTRTPTVDESTTSLSIDAGGYDGSHGFDMSRDAWRLTLPTSPIEELGFVVNAGLGRIALSGAQIGRLDMTTNAAETTVDLSSASVASVSGTVNAGLLSLHLPATTDVVGSMRVNAGMLQVCAPTGLGLQIHHTGVLNNISVNGLRQTGADWQSPGYASAIYHADLTITVDLGNVEIDPIGGCK